MKLYIVLSNGLTLTLTFVSYICLLHLSLTFVSYICLLHLSLTFVSYILQTKNIL